MSTARVVACCVHPAGYALVADWAERYGHDLVLLVTLPGSGHYGSAPTVLDRAGGRDVLITGKLRTVAAPLVAALEPDLVVSSAFPRLIPTEITSVPRYGAVNLHPSPLPRGRGPCPQRLTYEGAETVGATLHRTGEGFDTGAILSRRERPLRVDELTPDGLMAAWQGLLAEALDEGTARALAGERGEPQDDATATYAGHFTDDEYLLDWSAPALTLQRQIAALNMVGPRARGRFDGTERVVRAIRRLPDDAPPASPGTVLHRDGDTYRIRVGDGTVELTAAGAGEQTR